MYSACVKLRWKLHGESARGFVMYARATRSTYYCEEEARRFRRETSELCGSESSDDVINIEKRLKQIRSVELWKDMEDSHDIYLPRRILKVSWKLGNDSFTKFKIMA